MREGCVKVVRRESNNSGVTNWRNISSVGNVTHIRDISTVGDVSNARDISNDSVRDIFGYSKLYGHKV